MISHITTASDRLPSPPTVAAPIVALTPETVRDAVHALCYAKPLGDSPLIGLAVVAASLREEGLADGHRSRAWALSKLIHDLVAERLDRLRSGEGPTPWSTMTADEALEWLASDLRADDLEREAWGTLYYRYLSGVDHPVGRAVAATGTPQRTLHRRAERGCRLLAEALRAREAEIVERSATAAATAAVKAPALPLQPGRLIGRAAEVSALRGLVGRHRLVTLTGPGGTGKTRLALQLAFAMRRDFEDGAAFADLSTLDHPDMVDEVVAGALGLSPGTARPPIEALLDHLADRSLLLVIDNCEHVVGQAAAVAEAILGRAPSVRIVATSREPLRIAGERMWRVPPLALPDAEVVRALERLVASPAVELFVERAESARADFELTARNAPAVAELCARLDGLPLAIELAAARVGMLPPEAILDRIDERFGLLTTGRRTAQSRQRTLRAAIDWSHDLLDPAERAVFRQLAVFRGGWTLEAAEAVCDVESALDGDALGEGAPSVLDLIGRLVDKSLVVAEQANGAARYRFLDSIHAYAREQLEASGDGPGARRRHLHAVIDMAEAFRILERGTPEQEVALARLEVEHDNVRAAFAYAREASDARAGLRLGATLGWSFYAHGHLVEGRRLLESALDIPGADDRSMDRATTLNHLGILANHRGDFAEARRRLLESLAIHRENGDELRASSVHVNLGIEALLRGDLDAAQGSFERAREVQGDRPGLLANLGLVALRRADYAAAREHFDAVMPMARRARDSRLIGNVLINLGAIERREGNVARARDLLEEGMQIARGQNDRSTVVFILQELGRVAVAAGDGDGARARFGQSAALAAEIGDRMSAVELLEGLAELAAFEAAPRRVARLLGAAAAGRESLGSRPDAERVENVERLGRRARSTLGAAGFEEAAKAGRAMGVEAAVELGLGLGGGGSREAGVPGE